MCCINGVKAIFFGCWATVQAKDGCVFVAKMVKKNNILLKDILFYCVIYIILWYWILK